MPLTIDWFFSGVLFLMLPNHAVYYLQVANSEAFKATFRGFAKIEIPFTTASGRYFGHGTNHLLRPPVTGRDAH